MRFQPQARIQARPNCLGAQIVRGVVEIGRRVIERHDDSPICVWPQIPCIKIQTIAPLPQQHRWESSVNYEHLPPPTLAEATELVEATVAAFQTGIGEVRTAATVLRLLAIAQAWIADQKIADGGRDVPPPLHFQQVIIGPPPARMTGLGAVEPIAGDQPGRSDLPATVELLSIPQCNHRYDVVLGLSDAATAMLRRSAKLPHSGA